ncbi:LacI family DNA-binding transcriptional regulator [candidate division KSB1 bacterium]|nr:LacI family DNA-binding transcriptional regulator [candidate division KSB1 bacterium]
MSVTQKDIARKLNVSVMTVSKALRGHPDISEKMRKRVEKTAREMNYTVNVLARSLVQKRTNTIGVVVPDISESFYAEIIHGIEAVARQNDYNILLANSDNNPDLERKAIQTLLEKRIDGLLLAPTELDNSYVQTLQTMSTPFVLLNSTPSQLDCDSISVDRGFGARLSIDHLIQQGYQEIYYFYTFQHMEQTRQSIKVCLETFKNHKMPGSQLYLIHCSRHDMDEFYSRAKELICDIGKRIGIFAWDDEMAMGIYRAVTEKNMQIPEQIGIIGFDDIKISQYLPHALTTVHYPKYEMGKKGAERLIKKIAAKRMPAVKKIQLKLELKIRETT